MEYRSSIELPVIDPAQLHIHKGDLSFDLMKRVLWGCLVFILGVACSPGGPTSGSSSTVSGLAPTTSTSTSIAVDGMVLGEQIPGMDLWALVSGNDLDADRINLVFAPWGWDDRDAFLELVSGSLSWTGDGYLFDGGGQITSSVESAMGAGLGLFAVEPWRSSVDLFNLWYTDLEPETPVSWLNSDDQPFPLDDVVVVTIAVDAYRFNPDLTSVAGQDGAFVGPGPPQRPDSGRPFAHGVVLVDSSYPVAGLIDIPHELGHGMFNLPDEYVGARFGFDGREDLSSWPSCAEDTVEGTAWWGDLEGDVDPMIDIWFDEMAAAGYPLGDTRQYWETQIEVGAVDGGCYDVPGSVRATSDSLMNTSIPVLGSVNRQWAEQVFDLWEGTPRR